MPNEGNKILEEMSLQISFRQSVQKIPLIPVTSLTSSQEVLANRDSLLIHWILHGKEKKNIPSISHNKHVDEM